MSHAATVLLALVIGSSAFSGALGCSSTVGDAFGGEGGSGADGGGGAAPGGGGTAPGGAGGVGGQGGVGGVGGTPQGGGPGTGGAPQGGGPTTGGGDPGGGGPGGGTPVDCTAVPPPPVAHETIPGFTTSEDFVFDSMGNYVSIDSNGNLVRITKAGVKSLWIPGFNTNTAGMVALADDSVVICDVSNGALRRAYPNGSVTTVIGGLNYPNGIDVGPDGYIYVAEDSGNRVRRVHPDTGVSTIVANMSHPNGIAFTDDPTLMYVGSYNNGLIYKVEQPVPGQPGTVTTFVQPNQFSGGGIDGIGVDVCGNVYASEYTSGHVYRITPEGVVSQIVDTGAFWIPNIKWGRGIGGFEKNVMYVADRDEGRLFGVSVNFEGVTEYFDL